MVLRVKIKTTWVHFRFDDTQNTTVIFDKSIWSSMSGSDKLWCILKRRWEVSISRKQKKRVKRLVSALNSCSYHQQVMLVWDGYDIVFTRSVLL